MGRRRKRIDSPVDEAAIRDVTMAGQGVAEVEGKAVFVDSAITGERVQFKRQRRKRNYDEAELLAVLEASPDRADPPCEYFSICGGCSLQHIAPDRQLEMKQDSLLQALERIGGVSSATVLPALAGRPLGYRRRARVGAKLVDKKERVLVGFREKRKPYIADMRSCKTLAPRLAALLEPLSELIAALTIVRSVPQVEMSLGDERMSLVFRVLEEPSAEDHDKLRAFGEAHLADIWLQTGGPQTLAPLPGESQPAPLFYDLPDFDVRLNFGPLDFIQVNQDMNRLMLAQALELLGDTSGQRVLDLFCGIGNFSLPIATRAGSVVGVELDPVMVGKAQENAAANDISNAEFFAADLSKEDQEHAWWGGGFDLVVLDPPRAGALEALPKVAATGAQRILYVSCHAGSLARDAGVLVKDHGFTLKSVGAMDMFPQTSHVEAMALFERNG